MIVEVDNKKYKLIENVRDAFNEEEFLNRYTSFYEVYDFIVGDIAYSKLRLKGFNNKKELDLFLCAEPKAEYKTKLNL